VLLDLSREHVDKVVVGGDVLPGPMPGETLSRLLDIDGPVNFILGNGDREVLARMAGTETNWYRSAPEQWRVPIRWSAEQLFPEHQRLLAGWPSTCRMSIHGLGEVLFCHATPRNDTEVFTRLTPANQLAQVFGRVDVPVVVCGHTHMQFDRMVGQVRVVNAGSVGMPFGKPGAYWLMLGPEVELRHTPFDLTSAAARVRATTYPHAEQFAEESVLRPPTEKQMLATFSGVEIAAEPDCRI
jgi:predicted phosphodiesterase